MTTPKRTTPPWEKKTPKRKRGATLTEEQKAWARAEAERAGRRYPNLIDNMRAAKRGKPGGG
jgi:hypothetical protein